MVTVPRKMVRLERLSDHQFTQVLDYSGFTVRCFVQVFNLAISLEVL